MLKNLLLVVGLLLVAFVGLNVVASETGEVVVLTTRDHEGTHETRIWVVEHEGFQWIRSGDSSSGWYQRIRTEPEVFLQRGGQRKAYLAVSLVDQRDVVNDLMRQKYGWADQFIDMMYGRDNSIPMRLEPR